MRFPLPLVFLIIALFAAVAFAQTLPISDTITEVTGEVVRPNSAGVWILAHAPGSLKCYRNGARMTRGFDFSLIGTAIQPLDKSQPTLWPVTDLLVCDYIYR